MVQAQGYVIMFADTKKARKPNILRYFPEMAILMIFVLFSAFNFVRLLGGFHILCCACAPYLVLVKKQRKLLKINQKMAKNLPNSAQQVSFSNMVQSFAYNSGNFCELPKSHRFKKIPKKQKHIFVCTLNLAFSGSAK